MQFPIRRNVKNGSALRRFARAQTVLWGGLSVLGCLLVFSAASASATDIKGVIPANRLTVSAPDRVGVSPKPAAPLSIGPVITATKVDSFAPGGDINTNGKFDPGDTIEYTVIITNTGSGDATGVTFTDTVDSNTALAGGSVSVSPVTVDDVYTATGNISITILAVSGVLANDYMGLNPAGTISASDVASSQGGTVTVIADGSFTYSPPANFAGADTFHYTLSNSTGSSIGTVTIHVSDRILFVSSSGVGNCKPATPCTLSLADGLAAPSSGKDLVFVESGTYNSAALSLNSAQSMAGQAISIGQALTDAGITLAPNSQTLTFPASTTPVLKNSATIVTLNSNNLVEDLSLNPSGGSGVVGSGIGSGTTTVRDITIGATGSANGVNLTSNAGGTFNFSNIGITAASGTAINATGGGTVNATQNNTSIVNTLATTTGTALNVASTTIGASGLTFRSITSNGAGPANGIILDTTGTSGGLTVSGNGGTCTSAATCTGGTITTKTGADGSTTQGTGIFLNSTAGVSLNRMQLNDFQNFAIRGINVTGFSLDNSNIAGTNGTSNAGGSREGDVHFDGLFTNGSFPTAQISNSTLGGTSFSDILRVFNSSGTLNRLTVSNTTFGTVGINGNDAMVVAAFNNGTVLNVTLQDSILGNAIGSTFRANANNNSLVDIVVRRNKFSNNNVNFSSGGGLLSFQGGGASTNATMSYDISCNRFRDAIGIAALVAMNGGSGTSTGTIMSNTVGLSGVSKSGSTQASGIKLALSGSSGTHTILVQNNVVLQTNEEGIFLQNNNGTATLNATVYGNTVAEPASFQLAGLNVDVGAGVAGDASKVNVVVGSATDATQKNDFSAGDPSNVSDVNFSLNAPAGGFINLSKNGSAAVTVAQVIKDDNLIPASTNTGVSGLVNLVTTLPSTPPAVADCGLPSAFAALTPDAPSFKSAVVMQQGEMPYPDSVSTARARATANAAPDDTIVAANKQPMTNGTGVTMPSIKFTSAVEPRQPDHTAPQFPAAVPTVSINIGTLGPNKSVIIKFRVTINNPWTGGNATTVSNQGTVSGSNFTSVLTDDPKTGTPNDPTVTQIFLPADMIVAKSHAGSFRQGDVGDVYTITVSNTGIGATLGTVNVTDTVPGGLTATGLSGTGWTCPTFVTCNRSDLLGVGASYPALLLTVNVSGIAPALVTNTVTVGGGGEITLTNDIANDPTSIIQVADLTIAKTHRGNFTQGDTGDVYTITVSNVGPGPTAGALVTLTDTLPGGLTATAIAGSDWACTLGTLVCTRSDNLPNGGSYPVVNLTLNVAANASPLVTNTVTVAGGGELVTNNDTANDPTTINQKPDLTVTKTHKDPFRQGDVGDVYTITVRNSGLAATSGTVFVTDTLPSGLTASGWGGSGWTCVLPTLTCNRSDVLGASSNYPVILLTVTVAFNAPATVTNQVAVSGGGELATSNDSASDLTNISQAPDLSIAKTHKDLFKQGDVADVYTITVSNVGFATTVGTVTVTDTLPSGLTATGIGGATWTCTLATLTCTNGNALLAGNTYPAITLTVSVGLNTAPVVTNTATVTGGAEINPSNNTAFDLTNIQGADLVVAKTHADPFKQGDVGDVYTITVSNTGTSTTTATVFVTDTLPGALTPTAIGGSGWTCVLLTLTCQRSDALGAASSYPVITLTVNVASNAPVLATNTVTVAGGGEANTSNDTASDPTNILALVDLQVLKSGPATVVAGANLTYTLVVTNAGPGDAQNVVLTDTLPAGTTFVSQSQLNGPAFSLSHLGNAINDTISTLAAGATATFQVVVQVGANVPNGTVLNNGAGVTSGSAEQNPADNTSSASTTVQTQADLQLSKSAAAAVVAGTQLTYTLVVTNAGPSDAQTVVLTDTLPAGTSFFTQSQTSGPSFTLLNSGNAVTDTISTLPTGATATFQVVVQVGANVPAGTDLGNSARLTSATADPAAANNTATTLTTVQTQADLRVTKSGPAGLVTAGTDITYTVFLINAGPSNALNVVLSDTLDSDTSFVSQSQTSGPPFAMIVSGNTITGSISPLAAGASASFQIVAHVHPDAASGTIFINPYNITNTVTVTSTTNDPAPINNSAMVVTPLQALADLTLSKTGPATVGAGTNLTYTVVLTNNGPSDAQNVVLSDTLPAGTVFVSQQQTSGPSFSLSNIGNALSDTLSTLPAGAVARFVVTATVSINVPDLTVITNTATITSSTSDPLALNNTASVTSTVRAGADLSVTKSGPASVVAGTSLTYTLVVSNGGPLGANAVVTDVLPLSLTFQSVVSITTASGSPSCQAPAVGQNGSVVCQQTLASGDVTTYTLVATVQASVPAGTILTNIATVRSPATPDVVPGNNTSAPVQTLVTATADLQIVKRANTGTAFAGDLITYTIVVTNNGPSFAANVVLTDVLPLSETFRALSSPGGWSCTTPAVGANGSVTCSNPSLGLGAGTFTLVVKLNYGNGLINTHVVNQVTVRSDASDPTTPDIASADVFINGAAVLKQFLPLILRQVLPGIAQ